FADSTAGIWIIDQNSPGGRLRVPIDSCDRHNAIHEIAIHLIANGTERVVGGGIRLREDGGGREEQRGNNSDHVRNGNSLFVCVHRGLRVFVWKANDVRRTAADSPG